PGSKNEYIKDVFKLKDSTIFFCGGSQSYGFGSTDAYVGKFSYISTAGHSVSWESQQDNFNCFVSINENIIAQQIEIFPNPTQDFLNISSSNQPFKSLRIYNITGQTISVLQQNNSNFAQISLLGYEKGIYILEVIFENGLTEMKKIVLE